MPISEEFRYRHQLPFRYRTKSISDIPISKIYKSIPNDPSKLIVDIFLPLVSNSQPLWQEPLRYKGLHTLVSDIGEKFIPISDIILDSAHFSPISDIPISGSVRYRWSRISDILPTYALCAFFSKQKLHIRPDRNSTWKWQSNSYI
jgi:hypothetical protein